MMKKKFKEQILTSEYLKRRNGQTFRSAHIVLKFTEDALTIIDLESHVEAVAHAGDIIIIKDDNSIEIKNKKPCPDPGAAVGDLHHDGCDVERCRRCGGQYLCCKCTDTPDSYRLKWTGEWPGISECREFGWYAKLVPGQGWVSCSKEECGATEDLNRLYTDATWSRYEGRFLK